MAGVTSQVLDTITANDDEEVDAFATEPVVADQVFKPAKGMSIPVPPSFGKLVEKQYKEAKEAIQTEHAKWDKCFELYRQSANEGLEDDDEYRYHFESEADENIIRNNVRAIMRSTYMQNPHLEFTDVTTDELADSLEYIVTFLMNKQTYPGLNMRVHARRWILHGQLTNFGVLRLDYQPHEGSQQQAVVELQELEAQLSKAKSQTDVKEVYAQLEALHQRLPLAQTKGMSLINVLPQYVIVDPKCTHMDLSDADWLCEEFLMDRTFMEQTYYEKKRDGTLRMISHPKVTIDAVEDTNVADIKDNVIDTILNARSSEQNELLNKNKVLCVYHYDKILRRVSLFNTEDWKHPLWVENDTVGISRFFRHFIIAFGEPVDGIIQSGEVSYYVGHVKQINQINRKAKEIRDTIFNTLVYDKTSVDEKEVKRLVTHLKNPRQVRAFGVAKNGDRKVSEILEALAPPSFQFQEVFDTSQLRAAVDRAANISEIERGQQFKTNTTNEQVDFYKQSRQETTGVLIDVIEDSFESLGWSISELLVSKYTPEEIVEMVGPAKAKGFTPMTVQEFNQKYRMQIAAGSIEKPTSEFKKQEALNIAQALGQVGQAAPGTTMKLLLKMFETAFSNLIITKEDWAMLGQEMEANLQKGVSTDASPAAAPSAGPPQ